MGKGKATKNKSKSESEEDRRGGTLNFPPQKYTILIIRRLHLLGTNTDCF